MMEELNEKVDSIDPKYIQSEIEKMEREGKESKFISSRKLQKKEEEIEKLKKEIEVLKKEVKEKKDIDIQKVDEDIKKYKDETERWKNEYYKAYADIANLRKDIERDHFESKKYRIEGFINDLITILDSFEISLSYEVKEEETKNYLKGFTYVYQRLLDLIKEEGVTIIEPKINDKFDEKTMEAVDKIDDDGEENLIKKVMLKGYKLYEHLVRPAMVVVSTHKATNTEEVTKEN